MREKQQQQEGRTMTTNYDELKTLDITVAKNEDGTPKNLGDNSYVAGWEENVGVGIVIIVWGHR
jgi:hypothetical protein